MNALEIQAAALSLPQAEKAILADALLDSISGAESSENRDQWLDLASKRSAEMRQNPAIGKPLDSFMNDLKSRIDK